MADKDKKSDLLTEIADILKEGVFTPVPDDHRVLEGEVVVGALNDQEKACFTLWGRIVDEMEATCGACEEYTDPCPEGVRLNFLISKKNVVRGLMWLLAQDRLGLWGENSSLVLKVGWQIVRRPSEGQRRAGAVLVTSRGGLILGGRSLL